jgi:pimeloyl-ACP methyl ester carboxylesterase
MGTPAYGAIAPCRSVVVMEVSVAMRLSSTGSVLMIDMKSTDVGVKGGRLPVWTQAGEPTTLVFLHLWGGSHRTFTPVIERLRSGCAVVSYDHRGWGAARDLPGPYGIQELADDALAVIAELAISRYILVGHSMGAKVAQIAASRRPAGLAALALIAPAPPRPAADAKTAEALTHAFDSRETVGYAVERMLTDQPLPAALREQMIDDGLAGNRDAQIAWPLGGISLDITAAAQVIEVPVQVLAGRNDRVDPPESLEVNLLPYMPTARMTVLEGTGHLSPLEVPGQIARELDQLASLTRDGSDLAG